MVLFSQFSIEIDLEDTLEMAILQKSLGLDPFKYPAKMPKIVGSCNVRSNKLEAPPLI